MAVQELSNKGPDGTRLGQSATDTVGFFGATPVVQGALVTTVTFTNFTVAAGSDCVNNIITRLRTLGLMASA